MPKIKAEPLKIGIVIPIYNVAKYLNECLNSVLNQSYQNFEVVLVNDGSTDAKNATQNSKNSQEISQISQSLKIALEYTKKDARFILIDKQNGGLSSARNAGIAWFADELISKMHGKWLNFDKLNFSPDARDLNVALICAKNKSQSANNENFTNLNSANCANRHDFTKANSSENSSLKSQILQNKNSTKNENSNQISPEIPLNSHFAKNDNFTQDALFCLDFKENSHKIHAIYANSEFIKTHSLNDPALKAAKIDYLIFLDSDDFWEENCLEECVNAALKASNANLNDNAALNSTNANLNDNAALTNLQNLQDENPTQNLSQISQNKLPDIVWFDWQTFLDGDGLEAKKAYERLENFSIIRDYGFTKPCLVSKNKWLKRTADIKYWGFCWAWSGMINFAYLRRINLRFFEGIIYEDNLFGPLLFAQSERIFVLPKRLYKYRIRANSTVTGRKVAKVPSFVHLDGFDLVSAWEYFDKLSKCEIAFNLNKFSRECDDKALGEFIKENFVAFWFHEILSVFDFKNDPYDLKPRVANLLASFKSKNEYLPKIRFFYTNPKFYPLLKIYAKWTWFYAKWTWFYEKIKGLERGFRKWRRAKFKKQI